MKKRIQLLDIVIDTASTEEASQTTVKYLKDERSKVIYFLNSETLLLLQENEEWKAVVEAGELLLPGNVNINNSIDRILGYKRDSFLVEGYFDTILDYAIENGLEFLIITEDEEKFISIQENMHEKRPLLTLTGMFLTEQAESLDHVVNEINSVAPDILIVALQEKQQLELLQKYRNQMNAGLLLFTGYILYNKAVSEAEVPESIQKLRIENLYKWFQIDGRAKAFFDNLKIKLRLKHHKKE